MGTVLKYLVLISIFLGSYSIVLPEINSLFAQDGGGQLKEDTEEGNNTELKNSLNDVKESLKRLGLALGEKIDKGASRLSKKVEEEMSPEMKSEINQLQNKMKIVAGELEEAVSRMREKFQESKSDSKDK